MCGAATARIPISGISTTFVTSRPHFSRAGHLSDPWTVPEDTEECPCGANPAKFFDMTILPVSLAGSRICGQNRAIAKKTKDRAKHFFASERVIGRREQLAQQLAIRDTAGWRLVAYSLRVWLAAGGWRLGAGSSQRARAADCARRPLGMTPLEIAPASGEERMANGSFNPFASSILPLSPTRSRFCG